MRARPVTMAICALVWAVYLVQRLVYAVDPVTHHWLFYAGTGAAWATPGVVLAPISHDVTDITHIVGNTLMFMPVAYLIEPRARRGLVVALACGAWGAIILTNVTVVLGVHGGVAIFAGLSGGTAAVAVFGGCVAVDKLTVDPPDDLMPLSAWSSLVVVAAAPLLVHTVTGDVVHGVGAWIGALIGMAWVVERHTGA
jgi:hypothetical protein